MRNAIVTINVGPLWRGLGNITSNTMIKYAHRIGADFININNLVVHPITQYDIRYEKFQIYDLLGIYDRIMLIDYDAVITKNCPDMFRLVPENKIGIKIAKGSIDVFKDRIEKQLGKIEWGVHYYNSGLIIVSSQQRELFNYRSAKVLTSGFLAEQNTITYRIYAHRTPVHFLTSQEHYIPRVDKEEKNPFIIHWAGGGRGGSVNVIAKAEQIKSDIANYKAWKEKGYPKQWR